MMLFIELMQEAVGKADIFGDIHSSELLIHPVDDVPVCRNGRC